MYQGRSFLAIIPARGGSKRLPRKNVLDLGGKPLIAWTIQAARGCAFLDEVVVTTDDDEIATVAKLDGANVPFMRPAELASDSATTFAAVKHVLDFYRCKQGREFDYVVLLQPTSPLRNSFDISETIRLLMGRDADAAISVCKADHSPLWMNTLPDDHSMEKFLRDEAKNIRSQDLPTNYRLNGAIYICQTARLLKEESFFISSNIYAYVMGKDRSVDIDDLFDFKFARFLVSETR